VPLSCVPVRKDKTTITGIRNKTSHSFFIKLLLLPDAAIFTIA
jgi:hypothetical protein